MKGVLDDEDRQSSDATKLYYNPDISRRLGNGFFYFKIAGVFLVVFLASAYAVWHKAKSSHTQEPSQ